MESPKRLGRGCTVLPQALISKKEVCKHQSYAKWCFLRAPRHKTPSLIIAAPPTYQTVRYHMPIGASVAPNDRYMQWAGIWRKQVWLGEKWSIAGEKKLNHGVDLDQLKARPGITVKRLLSLRVSDCTEELLEHNQRINYIAYYISSEFYFRFGLQLWKSFNLKIEKLKQRLSWNGLLLFKGRKDRALE